MTTQDRGEGETFPSKSVERRVKAMRAAQDRGEGGKALEERAEQLRKNRPTALCDSECEGRCRVCPADYADAYGQLVRDLLARVQELEAANTTWAEKYAMRSKLEKDNLERAEAAEARVQALEAELDTLHKGLRYGFLRRAEAAEAQVKELQREVARLKEPCYCCREHGCDAGCRCEVDK